MSSYLFYKRCAIGISIYIDARIRCEYVVRLYLFSIQRHVECPLNGCDISRTHTHPHLIAATTYLLYRNTVRMGLGKSCFSFVHLYIWIQDIGEVPTLTHTRTLSRTHNESGRDRKRRNKIESEFRRSLRACAVCTQKMYAEVEMMFYFGMDVRGDEWASELRMFFHVVILVIFFSWSSNTAFNVGKSVFRQM